MDTLFAHTLILLHTHTHTLLGTCSHLHTHTQTYTFFCTHWHMHVYIHTHSLHTLACTHIHTHSHTLLGTCTHFLHTFICINIDMHAYIKAFISYILIHTLLVILAHRNISRCFWTHFLACIFECKQACKMLTHAFALLHRLWQNWCIHEPTLSFTMHSLAHTHTHTVVNQWSNQSDAKKSKEKGLFVLTLYCVSLLTVKFLHSPCLQYQGQWWMDCQL